MKIKIIIGVLMLFASSMVMATSDVDESAKAKAEEEAYWAWAQEIWDSLDRKTGEVKIERAGVTLNVPENFYFLNGVDAEKVLVEVWGNPPTETTLGMLFPTELTPFDDNSWAVTVEYEEDGYVTDEDADDINYTDLLAQMKQDTRADSEERVKQGYEAIELIGWAADPFYDSKSNKLYWAKEFKFADMETNTLNYNIRFLGRKGVLVLNFIADMSQKPTIESNLDSVLTLAEFDTGSKYSDFEPDIDKVAAYGIGALVAGKVLAKTGFLAVALVFLKKFGILIVIAIGAFLKSVFSRKKKNAVVDEA